jgi:transposase
MTLYPQAAPDIGPVPTETARVARAAFPKGNVYLRLRDEVGVFYADKAFAPLFSTRGRPAEAPWRLALVSVLQYVEGLSDRQAAQAVRGRIDWKYALGLELTDAGFDASVLSEFRTRLVTGGAEQQLLDTLLDRFRERQWLKARGRQRTDSTHVLAAIRTLNRLESVGETLRHTLNVLAVVAPDWIRAHSQPEWVDRYGPRCEEYRLPTSKEERQAFAETIGADGLQLLTAIDTDPHSAWLAQVPAVQTLRQIWAQQYRVDAGVARWRTSDDLAPAAEQLHSPYDPDARYGKKRSTTWVGYKVHLTETCEPDAPHLITQVETTSATTADVAMTQPIHDALQRKRLLPAQHVVDAGYLDAELLVASQRDYGVDLLGPPPANAHWQAHETSGFDISRFVIDWQAQQAICPEGCTSQRWIPSHDQHRNEVIKVRFAAADCRACPSHARCTRARARALTLRPHDQYLALLAARQRARTPAFTAQYAIRAGVEGTLSQGTRTFGLRRARYIGQARIHLQHLLTAAALNFARVGLWLTGAPHARTRQSPFVALLAPAA